MLEVEVNVLMFRIVSVFVSIAIVFRRLMVKDGNKTDEHLM